MTPMDRLIQAALGFQADSMADPHAHYDAQLELAQEGLDRAAIDYVRSLEGEPDSADRVSRPSCVVCGEPQTDLVWLHLKEKFFGREDYRRYSFGFPVCDLHKLSDIRSDQYSFGSLLVEIE